MRTRGHVAYFALAIVFATLAVQAVVTLGIEYSRWAPLLTIAFSAFAAGIFTAHAIQTRRAKEKAAKTP